jgi:hypothetical protein
MAELIKVQVENSRGNRFFSKRENTNLRRQNKIFLPLHLSSLFGPPNKINNMNNGKTPSFGVPAQDVLSEMYQNFGLGFKKSEFQETLAGLSADIFKIVNADRPSITRAL